MKNKKIILGLGTITALGAMSVGFIACVKEKEVKKIVDEAGYSKLTQEDVAKLLANVSTLTKEQVEALTKSLSKLTKEEIKDLLKDLPGAQNDFEVNFSEQTKNYLAQPKKDGDIRKNNDIGHFASGAKVKDVIDHINATLKDKGWSVVENARRDDIVGEKTKKVLAKNGKVLQDGAQSITFKLKMEYKKDVIVETNGELTFDFFVGKKDLANLKVETQSLHHSGTNINKIVELLNKKEEFKNINLEATDFEIVANTKKESNKTETGKIKIKAKDESKKISGKIELILETVKQELKETHLTGFVPKNNTTKDDIVKHINTKDGFKETGNNITQDDFDFAKDEATLDYKGKIKITPKGKTEGEAFVIDIDALIDLKTIITNTALGEIAKKDEATNPTANEIIAKLKELNGNKEGIKTDNLEISNITATTAKVKGKVIYGGEVDVTFTITTATF